MVVSGVSRAGVAVPRRAGRQDLASRMGRGQRLETGSFSHRIGRSPVPYARATRRLTPRFATHLTDEGRLGAGTGQALVKALTEERPDLDEVITRIEEWQTSTPSEIRPQAIDDVPPRIVLPQRQ